MNLYVKYFYRHLEHTYQAHAQLITIKYFQKNFDFQFHVIERMELKLSLLKYELELFFLK